MPHEITVHQDEKKLARQGLLDVFQTAIVAGAGPETRYALVEYLTAHIRNRNTRAAYARRLRDFFLWCDVHELADLAGINSVQVAAYIEELTTHQAPATTKQALAAIRMMYDHLLRSPTPIQHNPAQAVRGPSLVVKEGKTPALSSDQVCDLFDAIETGTVIGLRDRALIGVMLYTFGRITAVLTMNVGDYHQTSKRGMSLRLQEKGGKRHSVPAHHRLQEYLDAYVDAAGIAEDKSTPLFRTAGRDRRLTERRLQRREVLAMLKRRALTAGLPPEFSPHWCRATGITEFLERGGAIEDAQRIAFHADPRTTKLYDRRGKKIEQDEIQRLRFERGSPS